ncbi:FAD-dependent monooxygenase [Spirosoma fluviale]|uniref:2-polyprenyl-6-methoxyphenol hydroxylase n=1 Tax=Spirosoma fluviale TaxID=1597977 RepID=A0A286GBJ0_9BACT|nr:FAD-dependent monooxygenase [Spirosoma fluviale]SOD92893.1 2-polyprenyl-6-methoxyphenol hydroxylase [Spirosoma fluviale]
MLTQTSKKVLISGASIAGPTLAYWLAHYGFSVTIVERAPALRLGGQNIDVNGPAQLVARKMGIEDAIRAANTGELGLQFIGQKGQVAAAFPKENSFSGTQELEIIRGDLVSILYERTKQHVTYWFGDSITSLEQQPDLVNVTFASGKTDAFQLVIAADGVRSRTRQLVFGEEPRFEYLGLYTAYLTIPRLQTDNDWWRWYTAVDRRIVMLRPDKQGMMRASVAFIADEQAYEKLSGTEQKRVLKEKLAGAGWETERIVKALDEVSEVYFDKVGQVKAPRWFDGRVGMIGDAAYCPTPLTGKGTTLAMVGAYLLAGELASHPDHQAAFVAYEQRMRPYVEEVQKLPPGVPWLVYPKTALGVSVLNTLAGTFASQPIQRLVRLFSPDKSSHADQEDGIVLPDYR